ncbi:MAG TPA: hypothetical protein PJ994_05710 [Tepidiformaceae bacterium]|nr:hypothetical protein [Tepidiformaceae bacterium]HMO95123.1 hypothetical protein [Tepidiformaceae bacterium]
MPTFEALDRFWREFEKLTPEAQRLFLAARDLFVEDLQAGQQPRPSLRVKRFTAIPGVWEMSFAPDGRALFEYGPERVAGQPHVIWLRIGTHDIFGRP